MRTWKSRQLAAAFSSSGPGSAVPCQPLNTSRRQRPMTPSRSRPARSAARHGTGGRALQEQRSRPGSSGRTRMQTPQGDPKARKPCGGGACMGPAPPTASVGSVGFHSPLSGSPSASSSSCMLPARLCRGLTRELLERRVGVQDLPARHARVQQHHAVVKAVERALQVAVGLLRAEERGAAHSSAQGSRLACAVRTLGILLAWQPPRASTRDRHCCLMQ